MPLRVGYVREHFSSPLLQFAIDDRDQTFTLVECPSGTGQLISRLTNDEIDVAIALTDPLISGIANGSKEYKLIGSYVNTPLNWAVITGVESKYQSIADLEGTPIGISRIGSGSQTMAYVMALQQGWATTDDKLEFRVNNDIRGLIDSVNDGTTSAFMWEWFTTKPFVDAGQARFIGSVPTPWPSWLIAAHRSQERAPAHELRAFLRVLSKYVVEFDAPENRAGPNVEFIKEKFGYRKEDIEAWLKTVAYPNDCARIPEKVIADTLNMLKKAGVVKLSEGHQFDVTTFIDTTVAELT
ncbi:periplasmic binding protein-like II [Multifurca ochricompacta]|uniref:Periplasmic binding protein-like II n=1 Tax=Multifurca ochricompacta TaxID=376703 RepID=A0AAD4QQ17_9AGAM|nr:periplasmic binding protein-like II [Multifurca ochricompacta]